MSRSTVVVELEQDAVRLGNDSTTGTAFMVYAAAAGADPVEVRSPAAAVAAGAPPLIATYVGDALRKGAPRVILTAAAAVSVPAPTEAELKVALGKLDPTLYGPGQVLIPGVSSAGAHLALIDHAEQADRCVLLDGASGATASALLSAAAAVEDADGARKGTILTGVNVKASGGSRYVPGSVLAAGLVAKGDARVGHANHWPTHTQGGLNPGVIADAVSIPRVYTPAELDDLADAGVSTFTRELGPAGPVELSEWRSLSTDERYEQLNVARIEMQLRRELWLLGRQFQGRQVDGRGNLFSEFENALKGYLQPLYERDALWGATPDIAYDVQVAAVNTAETLAAKQLVADVRVSFTQAAQDVFIRVITNNALGVAA